MGDSRKRNCSRSKKRHPPKSNTKRKAPSNCGSELDLTSSSAKKLCSVAPTTSTTTTSQGCECDELGNGLVNLNLLVNFLKRFPCTQCLTSAMVNVTIKSVGGLAQRLILECGNCESTITQDLSSTVEGR